MQNSGGADILEQFQPHVAQWFREVFASPTQVQSEAWGAISAGQNALVVAPTGSGKTLAAFLWSINHLMSPTPQQPLLGTEIPENSPASGVRVLYISPLKALGVDVQRNLRAPITGITNVANRLGLAMPEIRVGVRSGDTPANERAKQVRKPPEILITTPESAYLLATSKAAQILKSVDTIIIDEIHALAGTKRGVHLALTLERIARNATQPVQRIGLSATVRPIESVAQFLAGDRQVTAIAPPADKQWDLQVRVPVPDLSDLPAPPERGGTVIADAVIDDAVLDEVSLASETALPADSAPATLSDAELPAPVNPAAPATEAGSENTAPTASASGAEELEIADLPSFADDFLATNPMVTGAKTLYIDAPGDLLAPSPGANAQDGDTGPALGLAREESALPQQNSIWPFIEEELFEEILAHTSTLVFVNSRRTAERLTSRLNELYAERFDPTALAPPTRRDPAQLMKQTDVAGQALPLLARAHHGSVSKEERSETERQLKAGQLRAVVATSSLELGIDMGAVDLVVQVEAPPSVAAGLQRVGRAGHAVGEVSHGVFYPKHAADVVHTAAVTQQMLLPGGQGIESLRIPENALDVLLQQTVAAVAMEDITTDEWYSTVRRAYPYRNLRREVFDAVIELASGKYPDTDFAHLKPRLTLDPDTQVMQARPGAQRVAVTNGGTIPDRGMFGVFLATGDAADTTGAGTNPAGANAGANAVAGADGVRRQGVRVGELDEEMVYESRVGDIFTLGASSWRIQAITHDRVLVVPAAGHTGRLPFWTGDQAGRPAELGKAIGNLQQQVLADQTVLEDWGLDVYAQQNLVQYLQRQQEATGVLPDAQTIVFERYQDELGDWRIIVHSPWGRPVHAAWALAISYRIARDTGMDAQAISGDDGIILRLPQSATPPDPSFLVFDPEEITQIITEQVGNSALFASRFRECAARALLLPRKNPGQRSPLWQQRQRAAQLLDVARKYPEFPIILETVRECLHDVYDLDALVQLCQDLASQKARIVEVTTDAPSPFATSLLFNYTGAFMYEGDSPLAEKRAAALALDPELLGQLLGTASFRELFDPEIIAQVHAQLQRTGDNAPQTVEQLIDALRVLGPIPEDALPQVDWPAPAYAKRLMPVRIAGIPHLALVEDAALLRDGLGIPVPPGVAADPTIISDAALQLLKRWARSRGPFTAAAVTAAFGLAPSIVQQLLTQLVDDAVLTTGHFLQDVATEYVAPEVLRIIRARCLAAARAEIEPLSQAGFARFLTHWQQVAPVGTRPALSGMDGVLEVITQLAGVRLPASAWEPLVLAQRVRDYRSSYLDELCNAGEVVILGVGNAAKHDPWVLLLPAEEAQLYLSEYPELTLSATEQQTLEFLSQGGAYRFQDFLNTTGILGSTSAVVGDAQQIAAAARSSWWQLFEAGLISPDSFEPLRLRLGTGTSSASAHRAQRRTRVRGRSLRGRSMNTQKPLAFPDMVGRWAANVLVDTQQPATEPLSTEERSVALVETLQDRYGIITRGSVLAENHTGGFAAVYKVGSKLEESGKMLRGYVVDGLGAAQFARSATIDRAREFADATSISGWPSGTTDPEVLVLAATDPANPYGAAIPWPLSGAQRAAGGLVVLIDGLLAAYLHRGLKTITCAQPPEGISSAQWYQRIVQGLATMVRAGHITEFTLENIGAEPALQSSLRAEFLAAGAKLAPQGLKITGRGEQEPTGRRGRSLAQALAESEQRRW